MDWTGKHDKRERELNDNKQKQASKEEVEPITQISLASQPLFRFLCLLGPPTQPTLILCVSYGPGRNDLRRRPAIQIASSCPYPISGHMTSTYSFHSIVPPSLDRREKAASKPKRDDSLGLAPSLAFVTQVDQLEALTPPTGISKIQRSLSICFVADGVASPPGIGRPFSPRGQSHRIVQAHALIA